MDNQKKITIVDVARKAGVSKGTVDRVLHNRGEFSLESAEKVRRAVRELDYEPNVHASILASGKSVLIVCLLPRSEEGEYWDRIRKGILEGGASVVSLNVKVEVVLYDQYDPECFKEACVSVLQKSPSGVIIPPLFKQSTLDLAAELTKRGIPYVYVDSKLEDDGYLAYFGLPNYKSGYLSAYLMTERCSPDMVTDVLAVRLRRDKSGLSDPTVERRAGFCDFMDANFPGCRIHNVFIDPSDPVSAQSALSEFERSHPGIPLVVMFNSRVHLIRTFLESHPCPGRRVLGYDNLEKNIFALRSGTVSVLIGQHIEDFTARAVAAIVDFILLGKAPSRRDNYVHMDILTKYNVENY